LSLSAPPVPDEASAPKRPRLDTFVLQPEEDFMQQYSGPSKVSRGAQRGGGRQLSIWILGGGGGCLGVRGRWC